MRYHTEIKGRVAWTLFGVSNADGTWDRTIQRGDTVRSTGAVGRFVGVIDTGTVASTTIWISWEEETYESMVERFDARSEKAAA